MMHCGIKPNNSDNYERSITSNTCSEIISVRASAIFSKHYKKYIIPKAVFVFQSPDLKVSEHLVALNNIPIQV